MRRVLVIGSGGAGKSTFAARLAHHAGLPLIHLDAHYWRPGWIEPPKEEWDETVKRLVAGERWIIDGNYGRTLEQRIEASDTVIFLDLPRAVCLWRVIQRRIQFHRRARPDMTPGCPERLSWEFLHWVWTYPEQRRPKILHRLQELRSDQEAVVLQSPAALEDFLGSLTPRWD